MKAKTPSEKLVNELLQLQKQSKSIDAQITAKEKEIENHKKYLQSQIELL